MPSARARNGEDAKFRILAEPEAEYSISRAHNRRTGQRTLLAAPLVLEGRAIGYIFLPRQEVNPFSEKQIALLRVFADQAAIAVQNVRLSTETQRLLKETEQRARADDHPQPAAGPGCAARSAGCL